MSYNDLIKQMRELEAAIKDKQNKYDDLKEEYRTTGVIPDGMILCSKCSELLFHDAVVCPTCGQPVMY